MFIKSFSFTDPLFNLDGRGTSDGEIVQTQAGVAFGHWQVLYAWNNSEHAPSLRLEGPGH